MARRDEPNLFELTGGGATVSYSTTSVAGRPQLSFSDPHHDASFQGDEIKSSRSPLGRMVTVTLAAVPDGDTTTLTLVLPTVRLGKEVEGVRTIAVLTTTRGSIGGPGLLTGALQSYQVLRLRGTARAVDF